MEELKKAKRIKIEEFNEFLVKELMSKYESGLEGLRGRFQTLMTIFKDLMQLTLQII